MKFALITARYGAEITHGPEHVCRLIAEHLCERHGVDVLTTCARNASTWKNEYVEGMDRVRSVLVRRFPASGGYDAQAVQQLALRLYTSAHSRADELEWLRRTGTSSSALTEFLKRNHRNYDALIFFSCWQGTTVHGLAVAPDRSVLFPCAQLEPALRLGIVSDALGAAAAVAYGSIAERRLVRLHARRPPRAEDTVGVGVDAVPELRYPRLHQEEAAPEATDGESAEAVDIEAPVAHLSGRGVLFRRRHRLYGRFALYGGRVDGDSGCEELVEYFDGYAAQDGDTALVLMGVKMMKMPPEPWLRLAGVLPDRERMIAFEAADVALAPNPDDLVAEQVLESFAVGTPVLASARNAAAVEHCRRSNAGLYYSNRNEFVEALKLLMTNDGLRHALGRNGRRYAQQYYRWEAVLGRLERLIGRLKG